MTIMQKRLAGILLSLLLTACSLLSPGYETPDVRVNGVRLLSTNGVVPQFEINLHIINPNRKALALEGISYTIRIEEHELLSGVSNQLPEIAAYGEGQVTVTAVPDLSGGINLIAELVRERKNTVNYDLLVTLDAGGFFPLIHVEKTGAISLMGTNQW